MKKNGILFRAASGLLAAALTLSLTACGGSSSNSDASTAADSADSGATHLRLIYSPSLCAAPMYIAIENGYFEDEGLDIEQVTVDAAHVSEAIGADQVDVGMGLIGKMLQPLENGLPIKFTTGLHTGCTKLLVPGGSNIKSIADLKGKKISVQNGSSAQTILENSAIKDDITISPIATNVEALQQLELGVVDVVFLDEVVADYEIKNSGKDYKKLAEGLEEEQYAIAFRKNDQALRDAVQKTLSEMKADGKLGEISTKWFGSDITIVK